MRTPFGEWLEQRITERDWTLRQAAEAIGVEQSSVSRYINGVAAPSRANLRKIATAFGADRDELEALIDAGRPPISPGRVAGATDVSPAGAGFGTLPSEAVTPELLQAFGVALAERLSPQALREIADIMEREDRERRG